MKEFDPVKRFNERSGKYDSDINTIIPGYSTLQQLSFFILKNTLPKKAKVLVCGTGTSNEAIAFAEGNRWWKIVAFDIAREMIRVSRRKVRKKRLEDRVALIHGEITDIETGPFDAATSVLVMHFIRDKKSYLGEIHKRLKPGAVFILIDICGNRRSREFGEFVSYWKEFQMHMRKDKENIEETFKHIQKDLNIVSEKKTMELLSGAGFIKTRHFFKSLLINGFLAEKSKS